MDTNDYWRGGWANNPGLMTQGLPGTQAAMLDQRTQGNYGPVNALADILGAYMQKRSTEGLISYVSKDLPKELDSLTAPEMSQAEREKYNFDVGAPQFKYSQPLPKPSPLTQSYDFLHKNGPGMELNPVMQAGDGAPNVMKALQDFAAMDPNLPQNRSLGYYNLNDAAKEKQYANDKLYLTKNGYSDADADALLNQQPQYKGRADALKFRQTQQEHPDWFVGNTYVGTDENAKKAAEAKLQQDQQAKAAAQAREQQRNAPRYLSYQEVRDKAQQMKADALLRISRRYGINAAKQAEPMIENAIQNRLKDYGGAMLTAQRAKIDTYVQQLGDKVNTSAGQYGLLRTLQEYNIAAQQMGQPVFDTNLIAQYMKSQKVTLTKSNVGGSVNWYMTKADGGRFDDGSIIKPVMKEDVTLNPFQKGQLTLRTADLKEKQRHNLASEANARNRTAAAWYSATHKSSGGGSRSGGSGGGGRTSGKTMQKLGNKLDVMQKAVASNDHNTAEAMRKDIQNMYENGEIDEDTWYGENGVYNTQRKLLSQLGEDDSDD